MASEQIPKSGTVSLTSTQALKKTLRFFAVAVLLILGLSTLIAKLFTEDVVIMAQKTANENLHSLWKSYQHYYIRNGRVIRPKNEGDTVSEGQAYAMLRAVWQDDRPIFDSVYYWTENNLSRQQTHGDHLLAWRYGPDKMGGMTILDDTPALDADLDYALALFLAAKAWPDAKSPLNTPSYREKALAVIGSIMAKAVFLHPNGELVLLPWPNSGGTDDARGISLNPSYFSPGHYRIFEIESNDTRWSKLAADTYRQLERLLRLNTPDSQITTVPDWILMMPDGTFTTDTNRGYISGWDAFRLWARIRLDYDVIANPKAKELIERRLIPFLMKSMEDSGGDVASESEQDGTPRVKYSNAGMSAVYRWATKGFDPIVSRTMQRQALRRLMYDDGHMYYQEKADYYTNSWAWLANPEDNMNLPHLSSYYSEARDEIRREEVMK